MIPNRFGLIRQKDINLLACMFPELEGEFSEYDIEIIEPEYIEGYGMPINFQRFPDANCAYSVCTLQKEYDYLLIPVSTKVTRTVVSALMNDASSASNNQVVVNKSGSSGPEAVNAAYSLLDNRVWKLTRVLVNVWKGCKAPIIGFKRHRFDNVNPLGDIQTLNRGILQPDVDVPGIHEEDLTVQEPEKKQEEEQEEA